MIFIAVIIGYMLLLFMATLGFFLHSKKPRGKIEFKKVTIVIAARNEQGKMAHCIASIATQDVPKQFVEIIVVDDASTDNTYQEAAQALSQCGIQYRLIQNEQHLGKKRSLALGIEKSSSEIIVCRDADTFTVSAKWLSSILDFMLSTKKEFIIGPVAMAHNRGILSSLQETEMSVLTMFTMSSAYFKAPFLCNGANLAFTKNIFLKAGGYKSHVHLASGDDIFFLEAVKKIDKNTIAYLKNTEAIVYTFPEKTFQSLIHQKIRWSSKLFMTSSVINWLSAIIIGLTNLLWIGAIFYIFFDSQNLPVGLFFVLSKLLIDILLVFLASGFIKVKTKPLYVLLVSLCYPFYTIMVAVLSVFLKPNWKSN